MIVDAAPTALDDRTIAMNMKQKIDRAARLPAQSKVFCLLTASVIAMLRARPKGLMCQFRSAGAG